MQINSKRRPYHVTKMYLCIKYVAATLLVIALLVTPLSAQDDAGKLEVTAARSAPQPFSTLPDPLEFITGNMRDLENDGLFTITDARFDNVGSDSAEAIIWTLKTNGPITCGHVQLLLKNLSDVRFYHDLDSKQEGRSRTRIEVHLTLLDYADRIKSGAANSVILSGDEVFYVWIYMSQSEVRKLTNNKANKVVFSRFSY